ncbi:MAG: hypothetical protein ACD_20C00379G0009 [uncultured bacterium]|nr:MAG: hypothetical protein ACD_20C00379G0009 [uncultured bacterium]HBH18513.1 dephospho-CoA kinase [Cyanobacteria bacterium UBA9579]
MISLLNNSSIRTMSDNLSLVILSPLGYNYTMIKLGITGNIASGKSLVESFLQEEGVVVIDSDKIVHDLLENDQRIINEVYRLFNSEGIDVRTEKDTISREKVGKIVFRDKEKRKKLEDIIHPVVQKRIERFFNENQDKKLVAVTVPLLFEANMQDMFDYIIIVTVDRNTQIDRLMQKRNLSKEEALSRINAQMPQEEKVRKSDLIIDNSGSMESTKSQVKEFVGKLI